MLPGDIGVVRNCFEMLHIHIFLVAILYLFCRLFQLHCRASTTSLSNAPAIHLENRRPIEYRILKLQACTKTAQPQSTHSTAAPDPIFFSWLKASRNSVLWAYFTVQQKINCSRTPLSVIWRYKYSYTTLARCSAAISDKISAASSRFRWYIRR